MWLNVVLQRLYGGKKTLFNYNCVPTTVFTPLEYGSVGFSEEVAYDTYSKDNVEVYHLHFQPLEWELPGRNKNESFAKLVCLKTEKVIIIRTFYQCTKNLVLCYFMQRVNSLPHFSLINLPPIRLFRS